MKILVDMNLSPDWVSFLTSAGFESIHWSSVGNPAASDTELMSWAQSRGYVVFTHDLDFGTALALTKASGPSVIQVRTQDTTPQSLGRMVTNNLRHFQGQLESGALIVIDQHRARARILPLNFDR
jgi:predicted nuclease of predicted toxin-antitoxin system